MSVPTTAGSPVDADIQASFAATLVDEWVRGGVTRAVVCPGSRSTPLAVALAAHPAIAVHVRLDERSAGFTALGMGLASGHPAIVLTTSGTAAVELHPAVVEADLAGVPLIACTADRPPELQDVGAPQTIDQTHLFGRSPRWFSDPGVPTLAARGSWRSLAARAVAESMTGPSGPGPVHLNLPFREPLLGNPAGAGGLSPGRPAGLPWHQVVAGRSSPSEGSIAELIESGVVAPGRRGLIVVGAGCGDPEAVMALSASLGWPVLADPRSGVRGGGRSVVGAADGILRSGRFAADHAPQTIVRLGEGWASKVVGSFLSSASEGGACSVVVDPFGRWSDPERSGDLFLRCDPTEFCSTMASALMRPKADEGDHADTARSGSDTARWANEWYEAEERAQLAIDDALGDTSRPPPSDARLTEPWLARRLVDRLPGGATLLVSSSMPIRDVEAFATCRSLPRVLANRGANGIDGVVSTALGIALSGSGPTVALVGDLAFLHDVSALVHARDTAVPLTVVVVDNGGGGIFSFLPPASVLEPEVFDELFGTPPSQDVADVAAGFGWPVDDVGADAQRFDESLTLRLAGEELSVIRVRVPTRHDNVAIHDQLNASIAAAVSVQY